MNIVFVGNYGAGNLGDELILLGLLKRFFLWYPEASATVVSVSPEETVKFAKAYFPDRKIMAVKRIPFGVRSFGKALFEKGIGESLKAFREADFVVLGGGGLFADDESLWAAPLWYAQLLSAISFKKPIITYGLGVGPLCGRLSKYLFQRLAKHISFFGVRDEGSADIVKNFTSQPIQVTEDPIFFLKDELGKTADASSLVSELGQSDRISSYCILSLRPFPGWTENLYKIFAQMSGALWSEFGLKTVFIPFQTGHFYDNEIANKIIAHLKDGEQFFSVYSHVGDTLVDLRNICSFIKRAKFILGMRLHSNFLSAVLGIPFLPIVYSMKGKAFLEYGLEFPRISFPEAFENIRGFLTKIEDFRIIQEEASENIYKKLESGYCQLDINALRPEPRKYIKK